MKIDARRIRELRLGRQWSQEQLAAACGLNLRTVQRLEASGRASVESLRSLAAVFEVGPESLLASGEARSRPRSATVAVRSELLRFDDFAGRSNRHDYWWFLLACALVLAIGHVLHPLILALLSLVLVVPMVAAGTRRLRDAGESPWWQLFWLVPFGVFIVFWLQARPSVGPAVEGPDPDGPPDPNAIG